jgi:hypothetical protein
MTGIEADGGHGAASAARLMPYRFIKENNMKIQILAALGLATAAIAAVGTARADPTQAPTPPGYQIAGQLPGVQTYPPQSLRNMLACGFRYEPGTGTWQPGTGSP